MVIIMFCTHVNYDTKFVPAREWMKIFFEFIEALKAHRKGISEGQRMDIFFVWPH